MGGVMKAKTNPLDKTYLTPAEKKAVATFVRGIRKALGDDLVGVTLFGSKVRGDYGPESDVDLLILLRVKNYKAEDEIFSILVDVELATDTVLSPIVYFRRRYERSKRLGSPFIKTVEAEGVAL
jgi:predicted nucleotidyltransferase